MAPTRGPATFAALIFITACCCYLPALSTWCNRKPNCYCSGKTKVSISCPYVLNVTDLHGLFRTYRHADKLTVKGPFTTMPGHAFDGFSTPTLVVTAPLGDDFELAIKDLRNLTLREARFRRVPPAVTALDLSAYALTEGSLASVEGQFQNKMAAKVIVLAGNELSRLDPDAFLGDVVLRELDLSRNRISSLDPELFAQLPVLEILRLRHNFLQSVDGNFLRINPKFIDLYGNNLTSLSEAFHSGMWAMQHLDLGGNPHLRLTASVFNGTLPSLSTLLLSDSGQTELEPGLLLSVPLLKFFSARSNALSSLQARFFEYNRELRTVDLGDNALRSAVGLFGRDHPRRYFKLHLEGNLIETVSMGGNFSGADHLDLSRNRIRSVQKEDSKSLEDVKNLNLSSNEIQELKDGSFRDMLKLELLDLSNNPIRRLNGSLRNLNSLQKIHLGSASLEALSKDDLSGSSHIKSIDLRNNSLSTLHDAFADLSELNSFDVSSNSLTTLTAGTLHPRKLLSSLGVWMADNPWSCDCRLSWLKKRAHLEDNPVCSSPDHLAGRNISDLDVTELEAWLTDCPAGCDCRCLSEGDVMGVAVDCSSRRLVRLPEVLPSNAWTVDLSFNGMDSFDGSGFEGLQELRVLDLESNRIGTVANWRGLKHVSEVRLAGNQLRTFPLPDWSGRLSLSRNPWRCDCGAWSFAQWLALRNQSVVDLDDVRCGPEEVLSLRGRPIVSLTKDDLCPTTASKWEIALIAVSAAVVAALSLLCCMWRQTLLACCYFRGCRCLKRDSSRRRNATYDVFILSAEEDQITASEVTRALEGGKYRFDVCFASRDVLPPRTPEKVSAYMQQCSRILVLLSKSFLENASQITLLKQTLSSSVDFSTQNILFVACERLPAFSEIDPVARILLKNCLTLQWGECFFWEKLVYQLPKKDIRSPETMFTD